MYTEEALNAKRHRAKGRLLEIQVKSGSVLAIILGIILILFFILLYIIEIPRTISLSGRVEKEIETVESNYAGYIDEIFVNLNQNVSPGTNIIIIKKNTNSSTSNNMYQIERYYDSLKNKTVVEYLSKLKESKRKIINLHEKINNIGLINSINENDIAILNKILNKKNEWLKHISKSNVTSKQTTFKLETELLNHTLNIENLKKEITENKLKVLIYKHNIDSELSLETLLKQNEDYNLYNIEYEKNKSIDDKYVILKSSLFGKVIFLSLKKNQKISVGDKLFQIVPNNSKLHIVIKSKRQLPTSEDILNKLFTIKYVTRLGDSRSFKANPTSVVKYNFSSESVLGDNNFNSNDRYLIKFDVPNKNAVVNNNKMKIIHGTKVIVYMKQDEKTLSNLIFDELKQKIKSISSYVF